MSDPFLELEEIAQKHDLNVFQYQLMGFYLESGRKWPGSLRQIARVCKLGLGTCSDTMRELITKGLAEPYAGFEIRAAFVYLITDGMNHFKIGIAVDVPQRLAGLQTGNAYELKFICSIFTETPLILEAELQSRFEYCHIRGEWYLLASEDITYIKGLAT